VAFRRDNQKIVEGTLGIHEVIALSSASSAIRRFPLPRAAASLTIRSDKALLDDSLAASSSAVRGREALRGREGRILQIAFRGRAPLLYFATIGRPAASPIPASAPMRLTSSQIAAAGAGASSGQHDRTFGRATAQPHCWQSQTNQSEVNHDNCGFLGIPSVNRLLLAQRCGNRADFMSHVGLNILRTLIKGSDFMQAVCRPINGRQPRHNMSAGITTVLPSLIHRHGDVRPLAQPTQVSDSPVQFDHAPLMFCYVYPRLWSHLSCFSSPKFAIAQN
jgi:hypothetical protein